MLNFLDSCLEAADWIEKISGHKTADNLISLEDFKKLQEEVPEMKELRKHHIDFPLSKTTFIVENAELFGDVQLVRFSNGQGGYEYRWCE